MSVEIKSQEIKLVPLKDIKLNPKNRNKHPKEQIDEIARIIQYQGFRRPGTISNRSGFLSCGEGRYLAAKRLKMTHMPVMFQDYEDEIQEYADGIADNAIDKWAILDFQKINTDIGELGPFDISLLGIKDFQVDVADRFEDKDADEVPEEVEPIARLGQIYQLGEHRLMCGDSTDEATVSLLMNGEKADMVFTDPPYGMFLDADYSSMASKFKGSSGGNKYNQVIGDNEDFKPELIQTVFDNFDYCKEIFLWGADYYSDILPDKNGGSWVVWDKRGDESADKMFGSTFELCWSKSRHKRDIARVKWAGIFGMEKEHDKKRVHPTQKPSLLIEWFFDKWGKDTKSVVDIYGGSGSTLIACEKTNRKCFMMELDPHYIDVIIARWEKFTGQKAELLNG